MRCPLCLWRELFQIWENNPDDAARVSSDLTCVLDNRKSELQMRSNEKCGHSPGRNGLTMGFIKLYHGNCRIQSFCWPLVYQFWSLFFHLFLVRPPVLWECNTKLLGNPLKQSNVCQNLHTGYICLVQAVTKFPQKVVFEHFRTGQII